MAMIIFRKTRHPLLTLVLFFFLTPYASGQTNTEMAILNLYYQEKDLVVSATRHPKSISYVAENMTIITAEDIEQMNAHTVAEILRRTPGLFINFSRDFGAPSIITIQGSEPRHVLVILDGIPWNFLSSGGVETNSIPVGIIDRIEVIKGPASSSWGSSLGGVVNIITKETGIAAKNSGSIKASYGAENTQEQRAELAGKTGPLGLYLAASRQESDGLRDSRYFDNNSLYSKLDFPLSEIADIEITCGYSEPRAKIGDFPDADIVTTSDSRTFFVTTSIDVSISTEMSFDFSLHHLDQEFELENDALGLGIIGDQGDRYLDEHYDDSTTGGTVKLVWEKGNHSLVLGAEYKKERLNQTFITGPLLQLIGTEEKIKTDSDTESYAFFINDTIIYNKWSITPGLRYDDNELFGSFLSPSLGITYQLQEDTIIRSSVARGFNAPPVGFTSTGGLFLEPNASLEPEKVWSYQAGVETGAARFAWIKTSAFYHELENAIIKEKQGAGAPTFNDIFVNNGSTIRKGIELEVASVPIKKLSIFGGSAYVLIDELEDSETFDQYTYNIGLRFDDGKSLYAELFGHYLFLDVEAENDAGFDDVVWDFNLIKKMSTQSRIKPELKFTIRNIFNGNQYAREDNRNPQRWIEGSIKFSI